MTFDDLKNRRKAFASAAQFSAEERPEPTHRTFAGLHVVVENPKGSTRSGTDSRGKKWKTVMKNNYGYIAKSTGADGEGVDCFLCGNPSAPDVHIVHTQNPYTREYDEDKAIIGASTPQEAKVAFLSNYDSPAHFRSMTSMPLETFKAMLHKGKHGSVRWNRKNRRNLKTPAMFEASEPMFDDSDPNLEWRQIGSKNHKGGHPALINKKTGVIEGGELKGKKVSDLGKKPIGMTTSTLSSLRSTVGGKKPYSPNRRPNEADKTAKAATNPKSIIDTMLGHVASGAIPEHPDAIKDVSSVFPGVDIEPPKMTMADLKARMARNAPVPAPQSSGAIPPAQPPVAAASSQPALDEGESPSTRGTAGHLAPESVTPGGKARPPFDMQQEVRSALGFGKLTIPTHNGKVDPDLAEAYKWIADRQGLDLGEFQVNPKTGRATATVDRKGSAGVANSLAPVAPKPMTENTPTPAPQPNAGGAGAAPEQKPAQSPALQQHLSQATPGGGRTYTLPTRQAPLDTPTPSAPHMEQTQGDPVEQAKADIAKTREEAQLHQTPPGESGTPEQPAVSTGQTDKPAQASGEHKDHPMLDLATGKPIEPPAPEPEPEAIPQQAPLIAPQVQSGMEQMPVPPAEGLLPQQGEQQPGSIDPNAPVSPNSPPSSPGSPPTDLHHKITDLLHDMVRHHAGHAPQNAAIPPVTPEAPAPTMPTAQGGGGLSVAPQTPVEAPQAQPAQSSPVAPQAPQTASAAPPAKPPVAPLVAQGQPDQPDRGKPKSPALQMRDKIAARRKAEGRPNTPPPTKAPSPAPAKPTATPNPVRQAAESAVSSAVPKWKQQREAIEARKAKEQDEPASVRPESVEQNLPDVEVPESGSGAAAEGVGQNEPAGSGGDTKTPVAPTPPPQPTPQPSPESVEQPAAAPVNPANANSAGLRAAQTAAARYKTLKEFTDPSLNTPGRQWSGAARQANIIRERQGKTPQDYEIRAVPVDSIHPTQQGDDYDNSSSRHTAEQLKKGNPDQRPEDYNPVALDENGNIADGNHRHAAAKMNGDTHILAMVPVGVGSGKITNVPQAYEQLKGGLSRAAGHQDKEPESLANPAEQPAEGEAPVMPLPETAAQEPSNKVTPSSLAEKVSDHLENVTSHVGASAQIDEPEDLTHDERNALSKMPEEKSHDFLVDRHIANVLRENGVEPNPERINAMREKVLWKQQRPESYPSEEVSPEAKEFAKKSREQLRNDMATRAAKAQKETDKVEPPEPPLKKMQERMKGRKGKPPLTPGIAHAVGTDAGNASAEGKPWTQDDFNKAAKAKNELMDKAEISPSPAEPAQAPIEKMKQRMKKPDAASLEEGIRKHLEANPNASHQDLYKQGLESHDKWMGNEKSDPYNRASAGLASILQAKGMKPSEEYAKLHPDEPNPMRMEVAGNFHYPLASSTGKETPEELSHQLHEAYKNPSKVQSYGTEMVSRGTLPRTFDTYREPTQESVSRMESELGLSGSIRKNIDEARQAAAGIQRRAEMIEHLHGKTPEMAKEKARGEALAKAADSMESRAAETIQEQKRKLQAKQAEQEAANSPTGRAKALKPMHEVKSSVHKGHEGNILAPGRFISDGKMMIDGDSLNPKERESLSARQSKTSKAAHPQSGAQELWDKHAKSATAPLDPLGHIPAKDDEGKTVAYLATPGNTSVAVDAEKLAYLKKTTGADSMKSGKKPGSPVMLFKGGKPVGLLMPLNSDRDNPIDVKAARETAKSFPSPMNELKARMQKKLPASSPSTALPPAKAVEENTPAGENEAMKARMQKPKEGPHLNGHQDFLDKLNSGNMTAKELRDHFAHTNQNADAIKAELGALKRDQLERLSGSFHAKGMNKKELADSAYRRMQESHHLGDSLSYGMGKGEYEKALAKAIGAHTDEDVEKYGAERRAAVAERDAEAKKKKKWIEAAKLGMENPQTIEDFNRIQRVKGSIPAEHQEKHDRLVADKALADRAAEQAKRAVVSQVSGAPEGLNIDLKETKHTKTGEPLHVAVLNQRVDAEKYKELNQKAKMLGGWYSSFRGAGAIPGFQFKSKEAAEKFKGLLSGNADRSEELAQRQGEKVESTSDRLKQTADALKSRAEETLNADRKKNTARRADMAASMESRARGDIAKANSLSTIADKLGKGEVKYLAGVKAATHLDTLDSVLNRAKRERIDKTMKDAPYDQREAAQAAHPSHEDVAHVDYPYPKLWASDLRKNAEAFANEPGLKNVAKKLIKAAEASGPQFKNTVGGVKASGGRLVSPEGLSMRVPGGKSVRVHQSHDYRLIANAQKQGIPHKGPFYTADSGKSWATSPENSVHAALIKNHSLDLVDAPKDDLMTIKDPADIEALTLASNRLRNHPNRDLQRIGASLHDRAEQHKRLQAMGINSPHELRTALREYLPIRSQKENEDPIKKKERELIGKKIPGFFPTPRPLIDRMLDTADIQPGMKVLEPSAGKGDILDAIKERHPDADTHAVEQNHTLRDLLTAKGHNLVGDDAMTHKGEYDRIVMNPPFENGQDQQHVKKAYESLKPGGKLVAVVGAGVGNDRAKPFRDWLEANGGSIEDLPEGSFAGNDAFRQTGVNTKLVTIEKPKEAAQFSADPDPFTPTPMDILRARMRQSRQLQNA